MSTRRTEATAGPASHDPVRIEVSLHGRRHLHKVQTDIFLAGVGVRRTGDHIHWSMDCVDMTMPRETTQDFLSKTLHMLDDEDKWLIVEPILHELMRHGYRFRELGG